MSGNGEIVRIPPTKGESIYMRAIKVLMVALTMAASLVVGAAATSSDGSAPAPTADRWCC
jgi:hypothetical protein